ncbi:uncharacterized protein NPIL_79591 [Nephila pilipes]|uniref:Gustatory receptor n=1 Tax=Nephila pilipes TaxID=299642 RepID=A0A8X6Q1V1_NEPPI|nr:uncharacterized protein NPIL_79591 [Nephila pilipes]
MEIAFYFIAFTVLSLFVVYYSFTCRVTRNFLECLVNELSNEFSLEKVERLLEVYGNIAECVNAMDDEFSLPIFLIIFLCMTGIFWRGYRFAFYITANNEYLLAIIVSTLMYSFLLIMVIISASVTNELASKAKYFMSNLPYRIPQQSQRIKYILRKNCTQDYSLTLWKIYVIDRSMLFTSFGTLLTYGMLIGALGNSFDQKNVGMKKVLQVG